MASRTIKNDKRKMKNKEDPVKKQKVTNKEPDDDLFSYGNKIDLTFGWTTKNTKTMMVNIDSSDEEDDSDGGGFERVSTDEENENADDSQELLGNLSDGEDVLVEISPPRKIQERNISRSPTPPPPPSQADLMRVQRQLRANSKKARDFDEAYNNLRQSVDETISPFISRSCNSTEVINLDDSISPMIIRNRSERKMTIKIRTRSGIKRFSMKAGEQFHSVIKDLANSEGVLPDNILLSLNNYNIMPEDTPISKNVTVADIIECIIMESSAEIDEENLVEIKIQGGDAASKKTFKVSKKKPLENLFAEYAEFRKISRSKLKFSFDGDAVQGSETPAELDMEDENMIDVRVL